MKKTEQRKISYSRSYYQAWPKDVDALILSSLSKYQKRYKYVRFGITTNAKSQYDTHFKHDDILWQRMYVRYRTDDVRKAKALIKSVSSNEYYIDNNINFPVTLFDKYETYYVYMVVGKRKKNKNIVSKKQYKIVDLFAGCGGLSCGLEQAGFTPWFVNEIVETFCETYKVNHNLSDDHYFIGDINELNTRLNEYKEYLSDITLVCGGPPCQGFSMANRQRIIDDPRNQLYKAYLTFLSKVRPQFFIMENVRGMAKKIDEIKDNFKDFLGDDYKFDYRLLKAQDYGVPQNRERFIMIGNRMGIEPSEIFDEIYKNKRKPFVLKDALEGLPHLEARKEKGAKDIENAESGYTERDFKYLNTEFYHFINGNKKITKLYNHKNRYNNPRDVEIYRRLPQGANSLHPSIEDIMPYKSRNAIFKDKYFKLDETQICKTITSHMKFDCNMYIHPWEARGLSPREAARIQTFPDDYVFTGAQNLWYAQVGNAVPVKLAKAIGDGIMKFIE